MTVIEDMLEFLKQQEDEPYQVIPRVQKVLGIKLKDCDDDYGAIGEHYIVKCKMRFRNHSTAPTGYGIDISDSNPKSKTYEATCLVSRKEFDKYRNEKQTVIWI